MADGCYARLNGSLLLKGQHEGQLVSVVGKVLSYDGQTVRCQCSDNQVVNMECDPNVTIDAHQGTMMELVGLASGNSNAVMTVRAHTNFFCRLVLVLSFLLLTAT